MITRQWFSVGRFTGAFVYLLVTGCTNDSIPEPDTQPVVAGIRANANSTCAGGWKRFAEYRATRR